MELKEILAVTGQPGLFKLISKGWGGIIVESLVDKRRVNIPISAKMSNLGDVAVFTSGEEAPLHVVLKALKEKCNGEQSIDPKATGDEQLRSYFAELLPTYDKERVYLSDIKKMIAWYNLLQKNEMLDFEVKEEEAAEEDKAAAATAEKAPAKAPAKAAKKAAPAKSFKPASSKAAGSAGKVNAPRKAQ
ncbi:MAG: DUF5606 domain-containing protein [Prevotellaceae bacterium]|jgi:hypothetical protein|nr:DUF5606 domain-containing protein [Prevotellaceae bacterium]